MWYCHGRTCAIGCYGPGKDHMGEGTGLYRVRAIGVRAMAIGVRAGYMG